MIHRKSQIAVSAFVLAALAGTVSAATVTFDTPVTIAGDSDVVTSGTLVQAYTIGNTNVAGTTINGVTFAPWAIAHNIPAPITNFNNTIDTFSPASNLYTSANLSSANAPYANLSSGYKSLLSKAVSDQNILKFQLGGLTPGQAYTVQFWFCDPSYIYGGIHYSVSDAGFGDEEEVYTNTTLADGGLGQYVIGNFTADASTQDFRFGNLSESYALLNGFQLRAVPEPASLATLAAGAMMLLGRRRKSQ